MGCRKVGLLLFALGAVAGCDPDQARTKVATQPAESDSNDGAGIVDPSITDWVAARSLGLAFVLPTEFRQEADELAISSSPRVLATSFVGGPDLLPTRIALTRFDGEQISTSIRGLSSAEIVRFLDAEWGMDGSIGEYASGVGYEVRESGVLQGDDSSQSRYPDREFAQITLFLDPDTYVHVVGEGVSWETLKGVADSLHDLEADNA